ncbi:MAG: sigma-70 family RNA polymerase sigma factor [Gemmatimonadetes bacterium]|nr:sigma-70 family RNA polymerase sigma factor [Gemmatimonadota bacterium]
MPTNWEQQYRETYDDLVRFLHRKVWDSDRAHDLVQETFVRALNHDPENPRAFLFTIAANLARDEARAAVRRKHHLELITVETGERSDPGPAEALEEREREAAVRRALESLSERDRDVLLLWDAGLSYPEIAEQAGLALGAVGTTLARARHRLVEAYEAAEGKAPDVARG